jgi:hypothetical protein
MMDVKIKYIEEEIEIRILSMKDNLDKLFEKFKEDLVQIKSQIKMIESKLFLYYNPFF